MYEQTLLAGWGDMDFNSHMANTAFLDKSGDVRMLFFAEHGFPVSEFVRLLLGPVIKRDEIDYHREIRLLEPVRITLAIAGMSRDGGRWIMRNEFFRQDGALAARVTSAGGWLDLAARKLVGPPPKLLEVLEDMERTDDFEVLPER